jgi:hypothetical protein
MNDLSQQVGGDPSLLADLSILGSSLFDIPVRLDENSDAIHLQPYHPMTAKREKWRMVHTGKLGQHDPLAYLIEFDEGGGQRSYQGCSMHNRRGALRYFPSPFDALIDISRMFVLAGAGQPFTMCPADAFRPDEICRPSPTWGNEGFPAAQRVGKRGGMDV